MMLRARRDRVARAVRVEAVAGDDAGDVRAVAPVVVGLRVAVDEIHELRDALALADWRPSGRRAMPVMPESMTATPMPAPL